jgi:hypothetical protein
MQIKPNKSWWLLGVGMMLGAGAAYAADARYDEATATIGKAEALLNAIVVPNEKPGEAFQRKRALKALERAKIRIGCAKANADSGKRGCPQARNNKFDDNDDDKDDDKDKGKHDHHHDHDHGKNKPAPKPPAPPKPKN